MGYPKRTAFCEKCGSVGFKIRQAIEKTEYVCSECYTLLTANECEDYETIESTCKKCNSDIFKIKIEEIDGKQEWKVKCINCKQPANVVYIDDDGVEVDRIIRELLLIKKHISKLESDIYTVSTEIKELENNIEDMNDKITDNVEDKINIHKKIDEINYNVDKQKIKTISLDNEVGKIRNRLNSIVNY